MDVGPGTPLIFIGPEIEDYPSGLTVGALYFVAEVMPGFCTMARVTLRGGPGYWRAYCLCGFKPLGDPDEILEEDKVLEDA